MRGDFNHNVQWVLAVWLLARALTVGAAETRPPNVVFILTDDQRWDMLGVVQREQGERARFPWLKTPNLDRLAAEGIRFRNAFVVNSLCSPSRATFLTGLYGYANGIVNNHTALPVTNVTWATELKKAGYTTAYFGKWHMGNQADRPGFDRVASFIGQGVYFDCKFLVDGVETKTEGYVDEVSAKYAIDFMNRNKDRPFALAVGFKATHGPFAPPLSRAKEYEGETPRATPNMDTPAIYMTKKTNATDSTLVNWGYIRCIPGIDDHAGMVLEAIDRLGLREDTIVVFAADNGYYLREHALGDKRTAYEESLRIPLLLRYPRAVKAGLTVDAMVLNVDIFSTLLDLAGAPAPATTHGRSLRPLCSGAVPADWRKAYFYCYYRERGFQSPMTTAVRTETAKLIRYPENEGWTEMFDLTTDPYETVNLFANPEYASLRSSLEKEYARQAEAVGFHVPDFADPMGGAAAELATPRTQAWVLEYAFGQEAHGRVSDVSGSGLHGTARGVTTVDGREGKKAWRFDGKSAIEVPQSPRLNPSGGAWTVEAVFRADKPDGIILARGGKTDGYALYLENGRPVFSVVAHNALSTVRAKASVTGRWVTVRATIAADRRLVLCVDGKSAGDAPLKAFIAKDPNDGMQIGADERTTVIAKAPPRFEGLVERVRIYSGEAP